MDDDDFMRLQDDGCPHTGEHVPDWTGGVPFWIQTRYIYVKMGRTIMNEIKRRRER